MNNYEKAKQAARDPSGYRRVMSSHKLLTRPNCKKGHSYKKYGVFSITGHLRCRRCMTDAQKRYLAKKAS